MTNNQKKDKLLNILGINTIFRLINRSKDVCLMYHGVVPDDYPINSWLLVRENDFKKQLNYLNKYWEIISIDSYLNKKFKTAKPKALITFDDGYNNNYTIVYPLLKAYGIPATIYIVTDFIDKNELFWFDKIIYSIQVNRPKSIDLSGYHPKLTRYQFLDDSANQWRNINNLLSDLKKLDPKLTEKISQIVFDQIKPDLQYADHLLPLTQAAISELHHSGLIEIGAHTARHEILTGLSDSRAAQTIKLSRQVITQIVGKPPRHFAYPNGDYNKKIFKILQENNFFSAVTVHSALIDRNKFNPFEIPRLSISSFDSISKFALKTSGFLQFMNR
jgi:peptidoglycan/xylan/chitin deacetylase (PgdA/CDA1 family)